MCAIEYILFAPISTIIKKFEEQHFRNEIRKTFGLVTICFNEHIHSQQQEENLFFASRMIIILYLYIQFAETAPSHQNVDELTENKILVNCCVILGEKSMHFFHLYLKYIANKYSESVFDGLFLNTDRFNNLIHLSSDLF